MAKIKKRSDYNREKTDLDLNQAINKEIKNQILSMFYLVSPSFQVAFCFAIQCSPKSESES